MTSKVLTTFAKPSTALGIYLARSMRVALLMLCALGILPSLRAQVLLTDSYLNPNAPASGAELNDNLANRQTGSLAITEYSSSTLNSGGASGFAYLNESSNLEILSDVGAYANVWTTTGFATAAATSISVDLWPTVTQTNGSGFASFLIGGGLNNTKANDGVIWDGGAGNAITVTLFGNGTLQIRDQSKFDGDGGEYIYYNGSAFSNNGFKKLSIVTSAFASGSQTLSFYLDDTAVLKNYTRAAGFTSDNYVGFQAYRNEGATQSVFDNLNISVGVFWSGGNGNWSSGFSPAIFDSLNATFDGVGGTAVNNISSASLSNVGSLVFGASAGAYTLTANSGSSGSSSASPIGIGGGITNNSGATQTINVATAFSSNASIAANAGNIAVNSDVAIGTGATLAVQGGNSTAINSVISGAGGLTKSGAGTLVLSGNNSYTGGTTVEEGKLIVNGSVNGSAVTVDSGATVGGSGSVKTLTLNGMLTPGNSAGTFTATSGASWNNGSSYDWEIYSLTSGAGTGWDLLSVSGGSLNLSGITTAGGFTINLITLQSNNSTPGALTGFDPTASYLTGWMIASAPTIDGFDPNKFNLNSSLFVGATGTFAIEERGGDLFLTYTAGAQPIPEPGTWAAAALLAGAAGYVRWRRRKQQQEA
jgi:autotransporter-associated beta strand protein